jgi:tetratricopeptide (TPR) repeat protein
MNSKTAAVIAMVSTMVCASAFGVMELVAGFDARDPVVRSLVDRGIIKLAKGDTAGALSNFDEAIRLEPTMWAAYHNRAVIYLYQRKYDLALRDLNTAIRLKPTHLQTAMYRASVNRNLRYYKESLAELDHLILTIRLHDKTAGEAYNDRAWLRATCPDTSIRNGQLAVKDATASCKITNFKNFYNVDTLAAAYAEAGDFDSALRYEEQAIALANPKAKDDREVAFTLKGMQNRLVLYKQRRPYHE